MKKRLVVLLVSGLAMTLVSGCLHLQLEGTTSSRPEPPTLGRQLIDLQKAKEAGAITEAEYQAQRAKLLNSP